MDLTQPEFLFIVLPILFGIYLVASNQNKKWVLLAASVGMYIWFLRLIAIPLFVLIFLNYVILSLASRQSQKEKPTTALSVLMVLLDLGAFSFYKIYSTQNVFRAISTNYLGEIPFEVVPPLGLSFIIFQMMACYFDTDRKPENYPTNFGDYLLYLMFFPKILMGPINRWPAFAKQLGQISLNIDTIQAGVKRFIIGFAKKVLIANQLAVIANAGFNLPEPTYTTWLSWVIILCFFFQIYYDFSGYIDMAIGVAAIFGIKLPENFDHPYQAKSVTDFWRKWHMTLTSWFRDYVFFPLEFARKKASFLVQPVNILIIFALTGLWHGFNLNYLVWGLLQGAAIVFEASLVGKWQSRIPAFLQRISLYLFIIISWVIFRSPGLSFAFLFMKNLFVFNNYPVPLSFNLSNPLPIINNSIYLTLGFCLLSLLPIQQFKELLFHKVGFSYKSQPIFTSWIIDVFYIGLFVASLALSASQTFIPSVYQQY